MAKFVDDANTKGIWFGDETKDYACGYAMKDQGVVMGLRKKGNTGSMDLALSMNEDGVNLQVVKKDGSVAITNIAPELFAALLLVLHELLS